MTLPFPDCFVIPRNRFQKQVFESRAREVHVTKDWRALRKSRVGSVSDFGRKARKRIEKRGASVKRRLAS